MAQIFQHSTAYEIINNAKVYGLSEDLVFEIKQSAISSIMMVKNAYEEYINSGMVFSSWNDPVTERDETFNTFMTLAYKFFEHAEKSGLGYRMPLKRMMMLLQTFCEEDKERYSQFENSPEAENFRATLMVAALSFAFEEDLREEFKRLNFPVDDKIYDELINRIRDTLMTNNFPSKPIVSGSNDGHKTISYTYTIVSVDLDNDSLIDPTPARLTFPVYNTRPHIEFRLKSNPGAPPDNPDVISYTFPTRTFVWDATDADGNETIKSILWALDDTTAWNVIGRDEYGILMDQLTLTGLSTGSHIFYVKAKDIASAESNTIMFPDSTDDNVPNYWVVKPVLGDVLLVDDFALDQKNGTTQQFYADILAG